MASFRGVALNWIDPRNSHRFHNWNAASNKLHEWIHFWFCKVISGFAILSYSDKVALRAMSSEAMRARRANFESQSERDLFNECVLEDGVWLVQLTIKLSTWRCGSIVLDRLPYISWFSQLIRTVSTRFSQEVSSEKTKFARRLVLYQIIGIDNRLIWLRMQL